MRMDVQRHFGSERGQIGKCGYANGDFVADAAGFNDSSVRVFGQQFPAQMGNHVHVIVTAEAEMESVMWGPPPPAVRSSGARRFFRVSSNMPRSGTFWIILGSSLSCLRGK